MVFKRLLFVAAAVMAMHAGGPAFAGDLTAVDVEEIRLLFLRQAAGETAHDLSVLESVLAPSTPGRPDPVNFVARAYRFWGREAVIEHFRTIFGGTWQFQPDQDAIRITALGPDVAHIYAPTRITAGAAGKPPGTFQFYVNEFALRTTAGWRISTIVPVPVE